MVSILMGYLGKLLFMGMQSLVHFRYLQFVLEVSKKHVGEGGRIRY